MIKRYFGHAHKQPYYYETVYEDFTMTDKRRIKFLPRIVAVVQVVPEKLRALYFGGVVFEGKLALSERRSPVLDRSYLFRKCGGDKLEFLKNTRWRTSVSDPE